MKYNLQLDEIVDHMLYEEGIAIEKADLLRYGIDAHYFHEEGMTNAVITLDYSLDTRPKQTVKKVHELGHHLTGSENNLFHSERWMQDREEAKAIRWQTEFLFTPERLAKAYDVEGAYGPYSMAEYLDVTPEEFDRGLTLLEQMYGPRWVHGQHVITFRPFKVKLDKRRRT